MFMCDRMKVFFSSFIIYYLLFIILVDWDHCLWGSYRSIWIDHIYFFFWYAEKTPN